MTSKPSKIPRLHAILADISSSRYHGAEGTWSSSQLKDLLDDEEVFIQKYIKKTIPRQEVEAFDTGTYFHTGLLEPYKMASEIAVFEGKVRHGKVWESFKEEHDGKTIVTSKQKDQGDGMIKAVKKSPESMRHLKGIPEVSLFVELVVWNRTIFAPKYNKMLKEDGWVNYPCEKVKNGFRVVVKVRADCLGDTFISDLKSTSSRATKLSDVRSSISRYKYDLSAALYLDMFSLERPRLKDFVWIYASKEFPVAASWRASKKQFLVGRAKWSYAILKLSDLSKANWEIVDQLRTVEPLPDELEWIRKPINDTDLL